MTDRTARGEHYRRVLVDAAEVEFAEHGYDGARMQAIAARAGVALGTLYNHFKGKSDLRQAIHDDRLSAAIAVADRASLPDAPGEALLEGIEAFVRWVAGHPAYLELIRREGLGWASPAPFSGPESSSAWEAGIELLASMVQEAMDAGDIRPDDALRTTRLAVSSMQVFVTSWNDHRTVPVDALVKDVQDHLRRAFYTSPLRS